LWGGGERGPSHYIYNYIYIVAQGRLQHMYAENFIYLENFVQKNEKLQNISKHP
jgi:hypothetical protein